MLRRRWVRAVCGWRSRLPALRVLARGRALRLLHHRRLEQRLQLLAQPSLLGGHRLRTATEQHGCRGEVLRCPPEERRVSASVLALASTFAPSLARRSLSRVRPRAGCVGARARGCSVVGSVAGLRVHPQLLVKKGQLLVELALGLRELVEPRPSLGVGGVMARCWLWFGAARC
jgi:hypothetical protein